MKIAISAAEVSVESSGIIYIKLMDNFYMRLPAAQEIAKVALQVAEGRKYPVLIHMGFKSEDDREVREYFAKAGDDYSIADAIVVHSPLQRLAATLYVKLNHPNRPTRIFYTDQKAQEWLQQFAVVTKRTTTTTTDKALAY